jgi:hypothetical protein
MCRFGFPHREVTPPGHADGYDGVANDYFLVRIGDIPDTPVMHGL